jgi:ATP-dependent DNA ligase
VFDGEIVSGSFNKTVSEVRRKDAQATDAIFNVFDILPMSLFSKDDKVPSKHNYTQRRQVLVDMLGHYPKDYVVQLLPRYLVSSEAEIDTLYESVRARGLEGLIIKDDAPYYRRRNHAWMKIKAEETLDLLVTGWEPGTGKYEGMIGALIVDHKGVPVNVGSGLSDEFRQNDPDEIVGRLIEVEFHEITPDGSLRHPRYKRFRDDKA